MGNESQLATYEPLETLCAAMVHKVSFSDADLLGFLPSKTRSRQWSTAISL
jgi:hypothetical protein